MQANLRLSQYPIYGIGTIYGTFLKTLLKTNYITVGGGKTFRNGAKLLSEKLHALMNDS